MTAGAENLLFCGRQIESTPDFPPGDPWSVHHRTQLDSMRRAGKFVGQSVIEFGAGDGRNGLEVGLGVEGITYTGLEIDPPRLAIARANFEAAGVRQTDYDLLPGDSVDWLLDGDKILDGWGIACLPQSPMDEQTTSTADGYDSGAESLEIVRHLTLEDRSLDELGLTLNAAMLYALSRRVDPDFNQLITFSGRIPPSALQELFSYTGWQIEDLFPTQSPIQQDPDTSVEYVIGNDDGKRFQERAPDGSYSNISAVEAEDRRKAVIETGLDVDAARAHLNVYHHLSVFHLTPER